MARHISGSVRDRLESRTVCVLFSKPPWLPHFQKDISMKNHISTLVITLVFFLGMGVLLYPALSGTWNRHTQSRAIVDYNTTLYELTEEDDSACFQAAEDYNAAICRIEKPFLNCEQVPGYAELLNIGGRGIMGYVTVEKIGVELPIYHGTSQAVLSVAAGHVQGSSLPTGGSGTHCVICAHSGLPGASLFTGLDRLELGDTFTLTVLSRVLRYQVDQIRIVEPRDTGELTVIPGEDHCTLMTCTPYGINSHRLLVRGTRVSEDAETKAESEPQ